MIIDAHNHPDWHGHDLDRTLKNMDEFGIAATWLLSWECPVSEYDPSYRSVLPGQLFGDQNGPIPFARCLSYAERAPGRFILGYAPDPRLPDSIDRLKAAADIFDVRVYGELKLRMMYDNPDAIRMYHVCGQKKLPVIVHIDYEFNSSSKQPWPNWWYGGGIDAFERAVAKCPDTIFLGHAPGFWAHISGDDRFDKEAYPKGPVIPGGKLVDMLRKYPNLHCDLSAGSGLNSLKRDSSFAVEFIDEFQDRILYARDYFDNAHQEFLNSLGLSKETLDKIYSGNALKIVPIG